MSTREAFFALIESAFNRWMRLDPEAMPRLAPLHGKVIRIQVLGLGLELYLVPGPDGMQVYPELDAPPDCSLSGPPLALARLGKVGGGQDELFAGRVRIDGDTEVGHRFGDILGQVDIDWAEQLSGLMGDIPAQAASDRLKSTGGWLREAGDTLYENLGDYLQEEARLCPSRAEAEDFFEAVDALRDDLARLEARIQRLLTRREPSTP
jgi:ubiquinone biosynthesis protein UbiJ